MTDRPLGDLQQAAADTGDFIYGVVGGNSRKLQIGTLNIPDDTGVIEIVGPTTSTVNAVPRWADTGGNELANSSVLIDGSGNVSGAASVQTPIIIGDTGDVSVTVKTGVNQVTSAYWEMPSPSNTYTLSTGQALAHYIVNAGNALNVRGVQGDFDVPGIGPLPPAGQMFLMANYADSDSGNLSNLYAVAWQSGTRYAAAITGSGINTSTGGSVWGVQGMGLANGAGSFCVGGQFDAQVGAASVNACAIIASTGPSTTTTVNGTEGQYPATAFIQFRANAGVGNISPCPPNTALLFNDSTTNPFMTTGSILATTGGSRASCSVGIDLSQITFSTAAFRSPGFIINGAGTFGYQSGAGGTVTQDTSKSTTVVLNKATGQITMHNATLNANTTVAFSLTNDKISSADVLVLNHIGGGTLGSYTLNAACGAGSATIYVRNVTGGNLAEAVVIQFALVKGAVT